MMTATQILRWIEGQQFTAAAARLLANGRCHSATARGRLLHPPAVKPAALGLSLQRICELTYWSSADAAEVAGMLLRLQRADGLFGPAQAEPRAVVAASATALRGLIEWRAQAGAEIHPCLRSVDEAINRGWTAIARTIAADLASRSLTTQVLTDWSIILWQLGDSDEARSRIPVADMTGALRRAGATTKPDDLPRLAIMLAA